MSTSEHQDPNIIVNINNLSKQGCLFKKHRPEFLKGAKFIDKYIKFYIWFKNPW